jgi:hypothetical protein
VGDGVCDCCDGSDEPWGCNNVCSILGLEATSQLRFKLKQFEAGAAQRQQLLKQGNDKKSMWAVEEEVAVAAVASLAPVVTALNGVTHFHPFSVCCLVHSTVHHSTHGTASCSRNCLPCVGASQHRLACGKCAWCAVPALRLRAQVGHKRSMVSTFTWDARHVCTNA